MRPLAVPTLVCLWLPLANPRVAASDDFTLDTAFSAGTRLLDATWSTSSAPTGNGTNPPFTATWDDITTLEASGGLRLHNDALHLRGDLTYGRVIAGTSSLKAYADDTRTQTTYHSEQHSDSGDVREVTVALGLRAHSSDGVLQALGEFGYTYSEQRLSLTDGVQKIPTTGPYPGLDSRYVSRWQGAWIGLTGSWQMVDTWTLTASARLQMVSYDGEMDLNLRSDLSHPRSIDQSGDGYAYEVGLGVIHRLSQSVHLEFEVNRTAGRIADGTENVNYRTGAHDEVPLESAEYSTWILHGGVRWEF